jgi:hypothetical protein
MKKILLALGLISTIALGTQIIPESVTIGTQVKPHASASLDLNGTSRGFLPNRLTTIQRDAIASPALGLLIYNVTDAEMQVYGGATWDSIGGGGGGIAYWLTGTVYGVDDLVIESNRIWRCAFAHTAGVFATDIANWTEVSKVDLGTSNLTGTLGIANGGTGKTTQQDTNDILISNQDIGVEITNLSQQIDHIFGSGITEGAAITDNGNGTVTVAESTTFIRETVVIGAGEMISAGTPLVTVNRTAHGFNTGDRLFIGGAVESA